MCQMEVQAVKWRGGGGGGGVSGKDTFLPSSNTTRHVTPVANTQLKKYILVACEAKINTLNRVLMMEGKYLILPLPRANCAHRVYFSS